MRGWGEGRGREERREGGVKGEKEDRRERVRGRGEDRRGRKEDMKGRGGERATHTLLLHPRRAIVLGSIGGRA